VLNALESAQIAGMTCFSMANVIGSTLTKQTSAWLPLTCGYEISVPATKTFTNQVITSLPCQLLERKRWAGAGNFAGPDGRNPCHV